MDLARFSPWYPRRWPPSRPGQGPASRRFPPPDSASGSSGSVCGRSGVENSVGWKFSVRCGRLDGVWWLEAKIGGSRRRSTLLWFVMLVKGSPEQTLTLTLIIPNNPCQLAAADRPLQDPEWVRLAAGISSVSFVSPVELRPASHIKPTLTRNLGQTPRNLIIANPLRAETACSCGQ